MTAARELDRPGAGPTPGPSGQLSWDVDNLAARYSDRLSLETTSRLGRHSAFDRFAQDQLILDQTKLDHGANPGKVQEESEAALSGFTKADRSSQIALHKGSIQVIEIALDSRFGAASDLAISLLEEEGTVAEPKKEVWDWGTFKNVSRTDRLDIVRNLEAENTRILLERFDSYLIQWRKHLFNLGRSPEEVDAEIGKLEDRFLNASPRGQVGISRNLRENLITASTTRFNTLLTILGSLSDPKRFGDSFDLGTDLGTKESWQEKLRLVESPGQRQQVIDELERRVGDGLAIHAKNSLGKPIGKLVSRLRRK